MRIASLLRLIVIGGAAVAIAAVNRSVRFPQVPWVPDPRHDIRVDAARQKEVWIDLAQFRALLAEAESGGSVLIIDAREAKDFAEAHVPAPTIVNVPDAEVAQHVDRLRIFDGYTIAIYCNSNQCEAADVVYNALDQAGYFNMRIYHDGWKGWTDAKLPSASGPERMFGNAMPADGQPAEESAGAGGSDEDEGTSTLPGGGDKAP